MLNDFFSLIFPRLCSSCSEALNKSENTICIACQVGLPKTNYHLDKDNKLNKIFWGRVNVEMVAAYYSFTKKSKVQHLIHQLKYKGNKEVGRKVGLLYGSELLNSPYFKGIDLIVPVPLHPKKIKKRGYNQSECFAEGLSSSMGVPVCKKVLYRKLNSETQTKKTRYKRWENVNEIFGINNGKVLDQKKVLLVDDVLSTGATLEACIQVMLEHDCKMYVAVIAYS